MKRLFFTLTIAILVSALSAQDRDACTSIMVGRRASTDGSVMTSHCCDSWYRTWMQVVPAQDYPRDTVMTVYEGRMHTEKPADQTGLKSKGQIPQASHTYRYLDTAYPCLNEHQLAIGETTYGGRDTMQNKAGMFMIEELERIVLQRCTTARDAIRLMGDLVKEYGYGDSGECLTIADPNEVWIFEIQGEGPDQIGAVWAAQRIPDDEVGVSANVSRIGRLDLKDKDHFMASANVKEVARKMGFWDGKSEFSFWRAYSGGNYFDEPKNYSVRELYIMQQLAPNAGFNDQMDELPVSFRPEQPLSVQTISHLLGSYYEGTDQSLSCRLDSVAAEAGRQHKQMKNAMVANPWMRPDEIALHAAALNDTTMTNIRTVSVSWCAYSTVIQLRSWLPDAIGGVAWISLDNPGQSPRFPIFAGTTQLPMMLGICGQHSHREDAALTHFRQTNRLASVRWGKTRTTMQPAQQYFLDKGARELPFVDQTWQQLQSSDPAQAEAFLNGYTSDYFAAALLKWDDLYKQYQRLLWAGY